MSMAQGAQCLELYHVDVQMMPDIARQITGIRVWWHANMEQPISYPCANSESTPEVQERSLIKSSQHSL